MKRALAWDYLLSFLKIKNKLDLYISNDLNLFSIYFIKKYKFH